MVLALDALFALSTAAIFAYVGRVFQQRPTSAEARPARDAFSVWWYGLAATTALGALRAILVVLGVTDPGLHTALTYLSILPLVVSLWGLNCYLVYLHTGSPRVFAPMGLAYAGLFVFFVGLVAWLGDQTVVAHEWRVGVTYERELGGPMVAVVLALLLAPVLASALLYGSLLFRVKAKVVRYRVGLTSGAFLLWFGSAAVASIVRVGGEPLASASWWPLASRVISLAATLLVLLAYRPPAALRARLESDPSEEGAGADPPGPRFGLQPAAA